MKNKKNIGLLAVAAITVLSVLACSWYSAEPGPVVIPTTPGHYFTISAAGVIQGLSALGVDAELTELNIPPIINGVLVTSIGDNAFGNFDPEQVVSPLSAVTIPDGVHTIGSWAFGNNQLSSITIPDSIHTIRFGAFAFNRLQSVTIPNGVNTIEFNTFGNNELTEVDIPDSVYTIGDSAFANNLLTEVIIPGNVRTIERAAFQNNNLDKVIIPGNVQTIGVVAFAANGLSEVTIHEGVQTIEMQAFVNNSLTEVTIPRSVQTIGGQAFAAGWNITSVTFYGNPEFNAGVFAVGESLLDAIETTDSLRPATFTRTGTGMSGTWERQQP